jgi:hypothetical protein
MLRKARMARKSKPFSFVIVSALRTQLAGATFQNFARCYLVET